MVGVSLIVPLYNEEERAALFIPKLISFCAARLSGYELILVNDGSVDKTLELLRSYASQGRRVRIVSYEINRGKGYAIRQGVAAARGDKVLFIDADGSIQPKEIPRMVRALDDFEVVVGSRSHRRSKVSQPVLRKFTGMAFNAYVNVLFFIGVSDTLCGFKGFQRSAAQKLFSRVRSDRWVFDVELFYHVRKRSMRLHQLPIEWNHRSGSKITPLAALRMVGELLVLRVKLAADDEN